MGVWLGRLEVETTAFQQIIWAQSQPQAIEIAVVKG